MSFALLCFIYGLATMFYGLTSWLFWRRDTTMLSRLVSILMAIIAAQCIKDVVCYHLLGSDFDIVDWRLMTAVDMIVEPIYTLILVELVKPGRITWRRVIYNEIPFLLCPLLYALTGLIIFFYVLVGMGLIYGTYFLVWTTIQIPRYNKSLMERFSYTEDINLNWLRVILYSFYFVLALWIVDCLVIHLNVEVLYMAVSLVMWMLIDFFIYKHKSVIEELEEEPKEEELVEEQIPEDLGSKIRRLFVEEQIYLNPTLKVSDLAMQLATNRTYISNQINREMGMTFYDYVNGMRVEHAKRLIRESEDNIKEIALASGFSSASAFTRVFQREVGMTPSEYRQVEETI